MTHIDFGLVLPTGPKRGDTDGWLDNLDRILPALTPHVNSIWMTDHFFWGDEPTYEAWTVLAFAAARWPKLQLGPIVLGQGYRNPALMAKMGATLQALCKGRFVMAIGAGWKEDEYHAYGYPFPSPGARIEQLEETLEILTRMWRQPGRATFVGKHYRIDNAYCEPKPNPIPPLIVGGGGNKTLGLAARYADWWNVPDAGVEAYRERNAALDAACAKIGRDPGALRRTWFGRLAVGSTQSEAEALSDGRWTRSNAIVGTVEQVVDQLQAFANIGVTGMQVEILGADQPERLELVRDRVLAAFSGGQGAGS